MTQEFFPINTPLINYFFYKAPFISNSYVLTGGVVGNPGANYYVNDLIILAGIAAKEPPAMLVVTATNPSGALGAVTDFIIASGGDYFHTAGAGLDQFATSGIGTGFTFCSIVPITQYFSTYNTFSFSSLPMPMTFSLSVFFHTSPTSFISTMRFWFSAVNTN